MTGRAPPASAITWKDWLPVISVAVMLIGALLAVGGFINRLTTLETKDAARVVRETAKDDQLNKIDLRTVRIETKLEILIPAGKTEARP